MILAFVVITSLQATTVWDGVYTPGQAGRGRAAFETNCVRCHRSDAAGVPDARIYGDAFMERWREDTLDSLFNLIRLTMPPSRSGDRADLGGEAYLDLLSYVLELNNFPSGARELSADGLSRIRLVGKDGPRPLPSNTMVQVTGCLVRVQDVWMLTRSTEPRRSRTPYEMEPEELQTAAGLPPGTRNFRLQNVEDLDPESNPIHQEGRRMLAKGILNLQPGRERIVVTALKPLASECSP
jgi:hypothetical protein